MSMVGERVLHIDKSDLVLRIVGEGLGRAGYRVCSAAGLAHVRAQIARHGPPDHIVIDLDLPEVGGDDLAVFLRQRWNLTAPLYLFSDLPHDDLQRVAEQTGAVAGINKDDGVMTLLAAIREVSRALKRKAATSAALLQPRVGNPVQSVSGEGSASAATNGRASAPAAVAEAEPQVETESVTVVRLMSADGDSDEGDANRAAGDTIDIGELADSGDGPRATGGVSAPEEPVATGDSHAPNEPDTPPPPSSVPYATPELVATALGSQVVEAPAPPTYDSLPAGATVGLGEPDSHSDGYEGESEWTRAVDASGSDTFESGGADAIFRDARIAGAQAPVPGEATAFWPRAQAKAEGDTSLTTAVFVEPPSDAVAPIAHPSDRRAGASATISDTHARDSAESAPADLERAAAQWRRLQARAQASRTRLERALDQLRQGRREEKQRLWEQAARHIERELRLIAREAETRGVASLGQLARELERELEREWSARVEQGMRARRRPSSDTDVLRLETRQSRKLVPPVIDDVVVDFVVLLGTLAQPTTRTLPLHDVALLRARLA